MKLVELHFEGNPFCINADFVESIQKSPTGCIIYMVGSPAETSYRSDEIVLELIGG